MILLSLFTYLDSWIIWILLENVSATLSVILFNVFFFLFVGFIQLAEGISHSAFQARKSNSSLSIQTRRNQEGYGKENKCNDSFCSFFFFLVYVLIYFHMCISLLLYECTFSCSWDINKCMCLYELTCV